MIRLFDFFFSFFGIFFFSPLFFLLWIIALCDNGSPIFKQTRVGLHQKPFTLIKFRTMPIGTKSVATHLIKNIKLSLFGNFLRKTKIDELPQLWNVLNGDMSLVGPRPCLLTQKKLIGERKKMQVFNVRPGITGLAQIKGISMNNPILLTKMDLQMIKQINLFNYFYYIFATIRMIFSKK